MIGIPDSTSGENVVLCFYHKINNWSDISYYAVLLITNINLVSRAMQFDYVAKLDGCKLDVSVQ